MFTGPVGPVEVFFYWPEVVFGNFYWPGAIGSPLASSPAFCSLLCQKEVFWKLPVQKTENNLGQKHRITEYLKEYLKMGIYPLNCFEEAYLSEN